MQGYHQTRLANQPSPQAAWDATVSGSLTFNQLTATSSDDLCDNEI